MPRYSWDIKEALFEEDVRKIFDSAGSKREAVLISLLWLYGPRPAEALQLEPENFVITTERVDCTIKTLKLKKDGKFKVQDRTLTITRTTGLETNIYLETIVDWVQRCPPKTRILQYTTRWAEIVINRLGIKVMDKKICPYHFRHSVFTWFARNRWTVEQIKYWKGATTLDSVEPYIHAIPQLMDFEQLNRGKSRPQLKAVPRLDDPVQEITR